MSVEARAGVSTVLDEATASTGLSAACQRRLAFERVLNAIGVQQGFLLIRAC